jgi:hypothetical protein
MSPTTLEYRSWYPARAPKCASHGLFPCFSPKKLNWEFLWYLPLRYEGVG